MATDLTVVIPVWDEHTHLLACCLHAVENERVAADLIIVNNASSVAVDVPAAARNVTLTTRHSIGAARNAALPQITTPFVVFADADDEVAPGSLARGLQLFEHHANAVGVAGRSIVDEYGNYRRGRTPGTPYLLASRYAPELAPLFWLVAFQCSITSTVLRTDAVREAGGFADTDIGED